MRGCCRSITRISSRSAGADVLLMIVCFLMMLSPCGAAYSLDSRRRAKAFGGPYSALVAPWGTATHRDPDQRGVLFDGAPEGPGQELVRRDSVALHLE